MTVNNTESQDHDNATAKVGPARDSEKTFLVCDICSPSQEEPFMVLRRGWEAHCRGKRHRAAMRARGITQPRRRDDSDAAQLKREARRQRQGTVE